MFNLAHGQITNLVNFSGFSTMGKFPEGGLTTDGTYLYGQTSYGGTSGLGSVYKVLPNGTSFTTIYSFTNTSNDGKYPYGALYFDGTSFYGMTAGGGANNCGTIFRILPDGTGYTILYEFAFADGRTPLCDLISDGTYLYGLTSDGGANSGGTMFRILPNGTGFTKLMDFSASTTGKWPKGSLYFDGTKLYGTTQQGGANDDGTIFSVLTDGTGFVDLFDFSNSTTGEWPECSLISDGTFLYGTTQQGGPGGSGAIFKIMPDGTQFSVLTSLTGSATGSRVVSDLYYDGIYMYGLASGGGAGAYGALFRLLPNGTGFVKLADFNGQLNGRAPRGSLLYVGGSFYSTTAYGGSYDNGTIFKYTGLVGMQSTFAPGQITLYPNPANTSLTVSGCNECDVKLLNAEGTVVISQSISGTSNRLDLVGLPSGIYLIQLYIMKPEEEIAVKKIIVTH